MITIRFNNEPLSISDNCLLINALSEHGYAQGCFAVAINQHFIPRTQYTTTILQQDDVVEIVLPMQGG